MMSCCTVALFALFACYGAYALTQCDTIYNSGGGTGYALYNPACNDSAFPYCTASGAHGIAYCTQCAAGKISLCDCPANFFCLSADYNPHQTGDFCVPMPTSLYGQACSSDTDCDYHLLQPRQHRNGTAKRFSCIDNVCRFCNYLSYGATIFCEQTRSTGIAHHTAHGSESNEEVRSCPSQTNAWNTIEWPATVPIPSDPYVLASARPGVSSSASTSVEPSASRTASPTVSPLPAGVSPSATPSTSRSGSASLSFGATPSGSPSAVVPDGVDSAAVWQAPRVIITASAAVIVVFRLL